jgi:hypothetical protein
VRDGRILLPANIPMRTNIQGSIWFSFYRFLVLLPLLVAVVFRAAGGSRGFVLELAVACGFVGLAIVAFEFALVARLKVVAGRTRCSSSTSRSDTHRCYSSAFIRCFFWFADIPPRC